MTSQLFLRACSLSRSYLRCQPQVSGLLTSPHPSVYQIRNAGHAKWQNIAKTKQANDLNKCKLFSRYVQLVRRAVIAGGRQGDPKLNGKLAAVLQEASKLNIPKATLERAIARALNVKIISVNIEIQGPGGCAIIARCETESPNILRRDLKKILRKFESHLMPDDSLISMFQSRGFIRAASKTKDNRDVELEFAEEAAIMANAEEVELETFEDAEDEELANIWVFHTDATSLNPCKGELEKLGLKIVSSELELVPFRTIDFGRDVYDKVLEISQLLAEHEQVVDVFHNVSLPKEDQVRE